MHKKSQVEQLNFAPLQLKRNVVSGEHLLILGVSFALLLVLLAVLPLEFVANIIVLFFFVILAIAFIGESRFANKKREALVAFAAVNNFEYQHGSSLGIGSLFHHGHNRSLDNVVSGEFYSLPFRLFEYKYDKGGGKNKRTYDSTVMEFTLPRKLPHMVIDSLVEPGNYLSSTLPIQFDASQKIDLEGDFYKYFALYAPDKYGITALSILAPDVMETLMRHAALCDVEIIEDKLYFYWPDVDFDGSKLKQKFQAAAAVLDETAKKLTTGNIYTHKTHATLHSVDSDPVRLKKTSWRPVLFIIPALFFLSAVSVVSDNFLISIASSVLGYGLPAWILYSYYRRKKLQESLDERFKIIK